MYGTVWRVRLKDGGEEELKALMDEFEARRVPGFVGHYAYRLDSDPNIYMSAVIFADKESYVANANSPEQQVFYQRMAATFAGEPEWFDGEIIDVRGSVPHG
jgi:heme-degrading monooxygenase HmoA